MQLKKRFAMAAASVVFLLSYSIHFSIEFARWNEVWFLGGLMPSIRHWLDGFPLPGRTLFFRLVHLALTLLALLLAVWLLRRIPSYQKLAVGWRYAATGGVLLFLGLLAAYGDLLSALRILDNPTTFQPYFWDHLSCLAIAAAAGLLIFGKDLLAPRVRKALHGRTKANARA